MYRAAQFGNTSVPRCQVMLEARQKNVLLYPARKSQMQNPGRGKCQKSKPMPAVGLTAPQKSFRWVELKQILLANGAC